MQKTSKAIAWTVFGALAIAILAVLYLNPGPQSARILETGFKAFQGAIVLGAIPVFILVCVMIFRKTTRSNFWNLSRSNRTAHLTTIVASLGWSLFAFYILANGFDTIKRNNDFIAWAAAWLIPITLLWTIRFVWLAKLKASALERWKTSSHVTRAVVFFFVSWLLVFPLAAFILFPELIENSNDPERVFLGYWLFLPTTAASLVLGYSKIVKEFDTKQSS
jgi:hypothetical protein